MKIVKMSFKNKILIPTIIIFIFSVLVISFNYYRLLELSVKTKTNSILSIFTDNLLTQLNHLDIIYNMTKETINKNHIAMTRSIAQILDQDGADISIEALQQLCSLLGIVEINIVNAEGVLTNSNFDEYIGFYYGFTEPTLKYMDLLNGSIYELQEEPRKSVSNAASIELLCHYTSISRRGGGFLQVGFDVGVLLRLQEEINIDITIGNTKFGENGYGMILSGNIVSSHPDKSFIGRDMSVYDWFKTVTSGNGFVWIDIDDDTYYAGYKNETGRTIIGLIPESEYYSEIKQVLYNTVFFISIGLIIMIIVIYAIIIKLLRPVKNLTEGLGEIAKGNLDARVEGNYNDEFALIKNAVNHMAESITTYIYDKVEAERLIYEAERSKLDLLVKVNYDALTNVYNRRYLDDNLDRIMKLLSRAGSSLSVLMADIDCFKQFNDTYGHNEGDECLKKIAKTLNACITREDDFVARYGGEEFLIILPNADENGAKQVADKILENIRALNIKNENSIAKKHITISIGITTGNVKHTQNGEDYVKRADEALYISKQNGRDQSTFLPM